MANFIRPRKGINRHIVEWKICTDSGLALLAASIDPRGPVAISIDGATNLPTKIQYGQSGGLLSIERRGKPCDG